MVLLLIEMSFDEYVFDLCKKAGRKLPVLARLSNYMSFEKRKILLKAFVESQFGYCPNHLNFLREKITFQLQ